MHQVSAAQTGNGKKSLSWWERSATKPQLLSLLPVRWLIIISHGFAVIRCVSPSSSWTKHDKPKYNIILLLHYISFIQIYPSDIPIMCMYIYIYILQIPQVYASITIGNLDAMGTPLGSLKDIVPHLKLTHLDPDLWCNHGDPTGSPGTSGASSSSGIPFTDFERLVNDAWRKNHRDGSSICKNSHGEELVLYCWGLDCYVPSIGGVTIARSF